MGLPPGIGIIFRILKFVFSWLSKLLFRATYSYSHSLWSARHHLRAHWEECGPHLQYSIRLAMRTDPEPRVSQIAFRATEETVKVAQLTFEASSITARYQQQIELLDVTRKPIVVQLTMPHQEYVMFHEAAGPIFSLDQYDISVNKLTLTSGYEAYPFREPTSHLTQVWFLQSKWAYKWGRYWNLDAIHWAKRRLREYWEYGFGQPAIRVYVPYAVKANVAQQTWTLIRAPIAWLFSTEPMIAVQFWLAIWSGLYILNNESELQWRWENKDK